jgi:hypothetical protein
MFNNPLKTSNPIEEGTWQVFQCQALSDGFHSDSNLFDPLKCPVLHLVLQHSKEPKVAQTQVRRIRWMEKAFKLRVGALCGHFATIGSVHVNEK